jgi:hypothetical protein
MPRYFFILVYPDKVIGDTRGTMLPSTPQLANCGLTVMRAFTAGSIELGLVEQMFQLSI